MGENVTHGTIDIMLIQETTHFQYVARKFSVRTVMLISFISDVKVSWVFMLKLMFFYPCPLTSFRQQLKLVMLWKGAIYIKDYYFWCMILEKITQQCKRKYLKILIQSLSYYMINQLTFICFYKRRMEMSELSLSFTLFVGLIMMRQLALSPL